MAFISWFIFWPCLCLEVCSCIHTDTHSVLFLRINVSKFSHYQVQDSFPFSIGFSSDKGPICTLSNGMLFPRGQPFPSVKILMLYRTNTFQLQAFYADQNEPLSVASSQISSFTVWLYSYVFMCFLSSLYICGLARCICSSILIEIIYANDLDLQCLLRTS